jgi:hypothetical protein
MAPMHTKDFDRITARAKELGWTVTHSDPLVLTKDDREIRVGVNMSGMINSVEWFGGPERRALGSGTASVGRILDWLETPLGEPVTAPPAPDLPETDLQAETPPPPVIPDELKESVGEVPAGTPMIPPPVADPVESSDPTDPLPDPGPAKKTPAKKAPAKKVEGKKDADTPTGGAVPAEPLSPGAPL